MKRMNKLFGIGAAALLTWGITSCTNELTEPSIDNVGTVAGLKLAKDPQIIAWSGTQNLAHAVSYGTRADGSDVGQWTYDGCTGEWENGISFTLPEGAVDITEYLDQWGNYSGPKDASVYYIPEGFNGSINLSADKLKFLNGTSIYNYGKITELNVEGESNLTIYNAGTWDWSYDKGGRTHTIYNTGTFNVADYSTILNLYNSGELNLERNHNPYWSNEGGKADIPNAMNIYSTTDVNMPDGGDFKAAAHIHGVLYSDKDLKIQNSETQYICGLFVEGLLEMAQGKFETAYIEADEIKFDGAHIWLLPDAHIVADKISQPNSASEVYGHTGSKAFIEAGEYYFRNKNNFKATYSDNIFFNVKGKIDIEEILVRDNGQQDNVYSVYNSVAEYIVSQNGKEVADRFKSEMSGKPACGDAYGTPEVPPVDDPTDPTDPTDPETPTTPAEKVIPDHVEVNLEVEEHQDYLSTHLSIHVRAVTDVEVFIPVPPTYYCDVDDMAIVEKHFDENMIHGGPERVEYNINGNTVTLTVTFEEGGIRVTTDGVNEAVIAYLQEKNGDGITFEVWNYYNDSLTMETLKEYLDENKATVEFLDDEPSLYVNAFFKNDEYNEDGVWTGYGDDINPWDCTVEIVDSQKEDYKAPEPGWFYNESEYNELYYNKTYSPEANPEPEEQ